MLSADVKRRAASRWSLFVSGNFDSSLDSPIRAERDHSAKSDKREASRDSLSRRPGRGRLESRAQGRLLALRPMRRAGSEGQLEGMTEDAGSQRALSSARGPGAPTLRPLRSLRQHSTAALNAQPIPEDLAGETASNLSGTLVL